MKHISLFSGIGGFDLAAQWAGWDNLASCEINTFGRRHLAYYWPEAYHHDDIKTLTGEIIEHEAKKDTAPTGGQTALFSAEDFHVNPTHLPGSDSVKRMNAICGPRCVESFAKLSPTGSWARTFSALLIGRTDWYSTRCRLIWKLKGTKYKRTYFQLAPRTLRTGEIGSGLLHTPTTYEAVSRKNPRNSRGEPKLEQQARYLAVKWLLPTPTAMDSSGATASMKSTQVKEGSMHSVTLSRALNMGMLPTPRACEAIERRNMKTVIDKVENKGDVTLTTLAKYKGGILLPTPMASDSPEKNTGIRSQDSVAKIAKELAGTTSQLNPRFVLEMMGFPPDWTELPFQSGAMSQSKPQETP